jgi:hypothetical protein
MHLFSRTVLSAVLFSTVAGGALHAVHDISIISPFIPAQGGGAPVAAENTPLELRGIIGSNGDYLFGLYDPAKNKGEWVGLNEKGADFVVKSHDASAHTVTVEFQGRTLNLALKQAQISSVAAMPTPAPGAGGGNQTAVIKPTQADEARRLETIAAEVRRRRALRQSATTGTTPPPPPVQQNATRPAGQPAPATTQ